jgi:IS5 family transposase
MDWEIFRPILQRALQKERKGPGGRPPYDCVLKFKVLVLQMLYKLSDDQAEYQINDRMSFMRFLELGMGDRVPDAKTIWQFRETLKEAGVMEELFERFDQELESAHLITHKGSIVDATFVDAPRQRNTREENKKIKAGEVPEEWEKPENTNKLRQKDTDARWTKKNQETHYGYKDHVKVDADSKLIVEYSVTSANVHDSQALQGLVTEEDQVLYADSAYSGTDLLASLPEKVVRNVHEKGCRNHPLTEEQKESNRLKSKIRVRVEHIFGFMTNNMGGIALRSIGIARAEFHIGLRNLVYNICRYEFLMRPKPSEG